MIYDLSKPLDLAQYTTRSEHLLRKGAIVELTEKTCRSGNQNRYLHVLIGAVALDQGHTIEYVKAQYYKMVANPDIFVIHLDDKLIGKVTVLRSSADLTKEEMTTSIDRFKIWAAHEGIYLPQPEDKERIAEIEYQMVKYKKYL